MAVPCMTNVAFLQTQSLLKANFFFIWILNIFNVFIFFNNFVVSEKVKDFWKYSGI